MEVESVELVAALVLEVEALVELELLPEPLPPPPETTALKVELMAPTLMLE